MNILHWGGDISNLPFLDSKTNLFITESIVLWKPRDQARWFQVLCISKTDTVESVRRITYLSCLQHKLAQPTVCSYGCAMKIGIRWLKSLCATFTAQVELWGTALTLACPISLLVLSSAKQEEEQVRVIWVVGATSRRGSSVHIWTAVLWTGYRGSKSKLKRWGLVVQLEDRQSHTEWEWHWVCLPQEAFLFLSFVKNQILNDELLLCK